MARPHHRLRRNEVLNRRILAVGAAVLLTLSMTVAGAAASASAHILPTTTIALDVTSDHVGAELRIPLDDLETASGVDLGSHPSTTLPAHAAALRAYLLKHFTPSTPDGAWTVTIGHLRITSSEQFGTGTFSVLTATAVLTPPAAADARSFDLGYDAVIEQVITHTILVSVATDWQTGRVSAPHDVGTIQVDTVTGKVLPLHVDLGAGSAWQGFAGMVSLGMTHIMEGTDHQLFLLTLLIPAPLLALGRRWKTATRPSTAIRRITAITLSFTLGHSVTLALGALGLPVPQHAVEALIAVSILVAALHAIRPIFPGREALVAGAFGLIHGMAFSATLSDLDLSGGQLALSLLGFNLGIEIMQLIVVLLVLPPLIVLSRSRAYGPLRLSVATLVGIAAIGWLLARVGDENPIASAADGLTVASPAIVVVLWIAAAIVGARLLKARRTIDSYRQRARTDQTTSKREPDNGARLQGDQRPPIAADSASTRLC